MRAHYETSGSPGHCFLLESVEGGERVARFSFVGAGPRRVIVCGGDGGGAADGVAGSDGGAGAGSVAGAGSGADDATATAPVADPLALLEKELAKSRPLTVPGVILPAFTGGAVGYIGYDCVRFFEPRVAPAVNAQADVLCIPDALFMLVDTVVVFDHVRHTIKVVSYARLPERLGCDGNGLLSPADAAVAVADAYAKAAGVIDTLALCLAGPVPPSSLCPRPAALAQLRPAPWSSPPRFLSGAPDETGSDLKVIDWEAGSNVGKEGYEAMVRNLKKHIVEGNIIQAVPSQRISIDIPAKCTASAFDIYRQLRILNPSPYMFYLECDGLVVSCAPSTHDPMTPLALRAKLTTPSPTPPPRLSARHPKCS